MREPAGWIDAAADHRLEGPAGLTTGLGKLRALPRLLSACSVAGLAACGGRQSVLAPSGTDAIDLARLFWAMLAAAVVLWILVVGVFFTVSRVRTGRLASRRTAEIIIVGGGIVFPAVVLGTLLAFSLPLMGSQRSPGDGLVVRVTAEQWWWRVVYETPSGDVVSANELRLPAGRRSDLILLANNVIHSFWVPALGGKADMFPGRETFMSLEPTQPGTWRGQCAEFCGASHALMAFEVVVLPPAEFADWLAAQAEDAGPVPPEAQAGEVLFRREGCGACHTIRGTPAAGRVGPDLTHVGGRLSLGAGVLANGPADFAAWIEHTEAIKPEVRMPAYEHLTEDELAALGRYLEALQ